MTTTAVFPEEIALALRERRRERYVREQRPTWDRAHAIASDLGDCERQMALALLAARVRPALPPEALERLEAGRVQERAVRAQLEAEGWDVVEQEAPVELRGRSGKVVLRGKIDGKLLWPGPGGRTLRVLLEIKDTSQANFLRWHEEADLRMDRWARKWWRQVQAYLLALGMDWGLLLLCHRGERRPIPIHLDYAAAEQILARAERAVQIHGALWADPLDALDEALNTLGLPYLGDPKGCSSCDFFRRVCHPPTPGGAGTLGDLVLLDDAVGELVAREQALADGAREHAALLRRLERLAPRGTHARAGDWIVTGRWEEQQTSPTEVVPAKPAGTRRIWRRSVLALQAWTAPTAVAESEEGEGAAAV